MFQECDEETEESVLRRRGMREEAEEEEGREEGARKI